jgi:hypothetical protein
VDGERNSSGQQPEEEEGIEERHEGNLRKIATGRGYQSGASIRVRAAHLREHLVFPSRHPARVTHDDRTVPARVSA